jgi:CubicO group peptidase (beta-lactamase class C family)
MPNYGNRKSEEGKVNDAFQPIITHLRSEIARGTFPSAQFVIGQKGRVMAAGALGHALGDGQPIPATENTIYDLASLTKPLVTTLLTMRFAERGLLDLTAPVGRYLEELGGTDKGALPLLRLLTHSSHLCPWRPLYLEARTRNDVVAAIAGAPIVKVDDTESAPIALYSDLNFILLGFILERLAGERLDQLAQKEIFSPLGLHRTMFNPPPALRNEIAATERGQAHERRTVAAMKFVCPRAGTKGQTVRQPLRRKGLLWGEVHDGNAWFMEGVAGHAGLFSTAREVFTLALQFIRGSKLLQAQSLPWFRRNFTPGGAEARCVGWLLAATVDCAAGQCLPDDAFGHNGFTGTSVWIDARTERVFVLLTNRVHPQVRDLGMKQARRQFHNLAVEALNRLGSETV